MDYTVICEKKTVQNIYFLTTVSLQLQYCDSHPGKCTYMKHAYKLIFVKKWDIYI